MTTIRLGYGDVPERDGYWLAGLTDGEGCFALWTRRRRVGRSDNCQCVSFVFKIALRADDRAVLERIQALLGGIGHISTNNRKSHASGLYTYNGRPCGGQPLAQFTVSRKEDLLRVVAVFRRYELRSKKRRDFDVWAAALEYFVAATITTPRACGATTSTEQIRPPRIAPLRRFKRIPTDVYAEIQRYEQTIKCGRTFVAGNGAV